jgi:hypothetical protein
MLAATNYGMMDGNRVTDAYPSIASSECFLNCREQIPVDDEAPIRRRTAFTHVDVFFSTKGNTMMA